MHVQNHASVLFTMSAAVIQELQTLCDAFTASFRCKDIDGMVAYYTKDCKIITPHENFVNESGMLPGHGLNSGVLRNVLKIGG